MGDVVDATFMDSELLCQFFEEAIQEAQERGVLLSLHLKATMMKVSDPVMFGHMVEVFFEDVFAKHGETFAQLGVDVSNGLGAVLEKVEELPKPKRNEILKDIQATYAARPGLAMVDSDKGITNLHVPSDVIVDASMPAMVRSSGKM